MTGFLSAVGRARRRNRATSPRAFAVPVSAITFAALRHLFQDLAGFTFRAQTDFAASTFGFGVARLRRRRDRPVGDPKGHAASAIMVEEGLRLDVVGAAFNVSLRRAYRYFTPAEASTRADQNP